MPTTSTISLKRSNFIMTYSIKNTLVSSLLVAATTGHAAVLTPVNDIAFPSSKTVENPLQYSGGNSPYFAGPNVNGISNDVPEKCTVQQAAYIVRHGSRSVISIKKLFGI